MNHKHQQQGGIGHSHGGSAPHHILIIAIILTLAFSVVEVMGGLWAHSLALLSDAGHMGSDALALGVAAFAAWISQKPPSRKHSYGFGRAEVIGAWISSLLMLVISIAVIVEAIERINSPSPVKGAVVMVIAFAGLIVNLFVAWLLARGERSLNIRAALLHVMSDILGSVAALISGAIIYFTHWFPIDPILSILIGVLIMISSLRLLRESLLILMEAVPGHIDSQKVSEAIKAIKGVKGIHDLHIWTLSSGKISLSAHIDIHEMSSWSKVLARLLLLLNDEYHIRHVTLQPEPEIMDCKPCE